MGIVLENIYPCNEKKTVTRNGSLTTESLVDQEGSVPWQVGIVLLPEIGDDSVIPTITCGGNIKFYLIGTVTLISCEHSCKEGNA